MHIRPRFVATILAVAISMLTITRVALAASCPPPAPAPAPVPVPGKPGESGWLIEDIEVDSNGNKIQLWCLKAVPGPNPPAHSGPDFALLYKPAGAKDADAVWIGACVFPGGRNRQNKDFTRLPNGQPQQFTKVTWFNVEPPPNGTHDWDYSYDPATGNLTLKKTAGSWTRVLTPGGWRWRYRFTVVDTNTYPAPKNFGDIKFTSGGTTTHVTLLLSGTGGLSSEAVAAVATANGNAWSYALNVNALGGSGTEDDPFVGLDTNVKAGDTFSIAASDVQDPSVSAPASDPANGGWVVDSFSSNYVTFRATVDAELTPGIQLGGFGFSSSAPAGTVAWALRSSNEAIGSQGVSVGPAFPPSQITAVASSSIVPVGSDASITATVLSPSNPLPGIAVTFTSMMAGITFNNGNVSADGTSTTIVTAANGQAVASFTAISDGTGTVQVSVQGTELVATVALSTTTATPTVTPIATATTKVKATRTVK